MSLGLVTGVYDIDLSNDTSFCMIKAPQGDGRVRYINFILYNNGELYNLPDNNSVSIQLEGINGMGRNVTFKVNIVNNMIQVPLIGGINDVPGAGIYRLVMTEIKEGGYGEKEVAPVLATFNFYIYITERHFNAESAVASDEYQSLLKAIANANGWKYGEADPPVDIPDAKINDFYLNTEFGKVWVLKSDGWEYLIKLQGSGVEQISIQYAISNSHTDIPETGWTDQYPTDANDTYIWVKQKFVMDDAPDDPIISYTVNYVGDGAQAWAVGMRGDIPVTESDPTYHNNSKYYAELAGIYKTSAESSATSAGASATSAEASATSAESSAADAEVSATSAEANATSAESSAAAAAISETNAAESEDFIRDVVETHSANFRINWETGELEYDGGFFTFWVDENGILRWGVEVGQ